MREVAAWLSGRHELRIWDESDKHYVGELMDSVDVIVRSQRIKQSFVLPFLCEPFARGQQITQQITEGENHISYAGTIDTPTMLIIRNPNDFPISDIVIRAIKSRR